MLTEPFLVSSTDEAYVVEFAFGFSFVLELFLAGCILCYNISGFQLLYTRNVVVNA